ncbi:MAG TPA: hypothetical protein VJB57_09730 [Dehalococcoidia bacterium]|nr:hypothetical protein [Dehalococcoidia bacterium]
MESLGNAVIGVLLIAAAAFVFLKRDEAADNMLRYYNQDADQPSSGMNWRFRPTRTQTALLAWLAIIGFATLGVVMLALALS